MRQLITSALFLFCASISVAQTTSEDYYTPSKQKLSAQDRVSASMTMGAGVSFLNSTKNTAYTTYVAPKIGYQLTPKFKLNVGLMHYTGTANTFMWMNRNEAIYNASNRTVTGNLLFVEGQYQLGKKMTLLGAVMYDANGFSANKKDNYKAASLGLEYKVTEHSSIRFQTTISNGQGNYYNNPYSPNPYYNNPMGHMGFDAPMFFR